MALALFDLDNTLIAGDSDYLWGEFLVSENLVDKIWFQQQNQYFLDKYNAGTLKISDWLAFQLKPMSEHSIEKLQQLRQKFITTIIKPIILAKAIKTINFHKNQGDTIVIITATNTFITRPIVDLFNVTNLIATELEIINKRYTGKPTGTITFQNGKITALKKWLNGRIFDQTYFYSDSHNDIPLLKYVDVAIAVDADDILKKIAVQKKWRTISFR